MYRFLWSLFLFKKCLFPIPINIFLPGSVPPCCPYIPKIHFFSFLLFSSVFSSGALHALWPSSCLAHFYSSIFYMLLILSCAFLNPPQVLSLWSETTKLPGLFCQNVFLLIVSDSLFRCILVWLF